MNNEMGTTHHQNPYLVAVVIGGLFFLAGQYVASQPQRAQKEADLNREITVQGSAEVSAKPDVAKVTLAVQTEILPTAAAATDALSKTFTSVLSAVTSAGVAEKDVQTTNLYINPVYDYPNGKQTQRGFQASESIYVAVRNLDTVSDVVAKATQQGVNQVGGISFEIDKPDDLKLQAQQQALENAKEKAQELARTAGVSLGKVKTFSFADTPQAMPMFEAAALKRDQSGGGSGGDIAGPPVAPGENIIRANVIVTYELK